MCVLWETGSEDGVLGPGILKNSFLHVHRKLFVVREPMENGEAGFMAKGIDSLQIHMPRQAEYIIQTLNDNGFEAYIVGGCVRDCLLGRTPGDWDITTSALPYQVKSVFRRTVDTGIAHGTVTVMRGKEAYEVTTYRIDGEYEDGRHPKEVMFTSSLEEDLKRRDFTINAMAYSKREGLIDVFDGVKDLREKRIRCVGNPVDRFTEDALRILRALRFSAQLGFEIEGGTRDALRALAPNLVRVSTERIQTELTKLLLSGHPDYIRQVFEEGIGPYISETFSRIPWKEAFIDSRLPSVRRLRWAALLRHQTETEAERILKELKLDNDTISGVRLLTRWWKRPVGTDEISVRKVMSRMSEEQFDDLLVFKEFVAESPESPEELAEICRLAGIIRGRGDCVSLKMLAVTGRDLMEAGIKPGPGMGEKLNALLALVLEHPEKNNRKLLIEELEKGLKKST